MGARAASGNGQEPVKSSTWLRVRTDYLPAADHIGSAVNAGRQGGHRPGGAHRRRAGGRFPGKVSSRKRRKVSARFCLQGRHLPRLRRVSHRGRAWLRVRTPRGRAGDIGAIVRAAQGKFGAAAATSKTRIGPARYWGARAESTPRRERRASSSGVWDLHGQPQLGPETFQKVPAIAGSPQRVGGHRR